MMKFANQRHRVISLLPAATEIVAALGRQDCLVGRSHECDHPASVSPLPVCSEPAIDVTAGSADIHRQVSESLRSRLSIYRIHEERIRELRPTCLLTQALCDVCAVSDADLQCLSNGPNAPRLVSLTPRCLDDLWQNIREVATALDCLRNGEQLIESLQVRLRAVAERATIPHRERPTVACIEWLEPLMGAGNWVPELIEIAGGRSLFGSSGDQSHWLKWSEVRAADPDVVIIVPCGFTIERTMAESSCLTKLPGWHELRAVREERVFLVDGHQYLNRPGPRLVDSAEILAGLIIPERFPFRDAVKWCELDESRGRP